MKVKIYKLIYEGQVVYIGKTTASLTERKNWQYKSNAKLQSIYRQCSIELIEETDDTTREHYWVKYYGKENLLNLRYGDGISKKEQNSLACKKYREKKNKDKI